MFPPRQGFSLTGQVREILLEQILSGRWEVSERLPSVAALARQSGLSRWPVQEAFEALRREGFLRQAERSGTFLASVGPKGLKTRGTVGVAMLLAEDEQSWRTMPYSEYRLSRVLTVAKERQYAVDTRYLRAEDDWASLDRAGAFFGDGVLGVISLYPFPHLAPGELPPDRLPFVHLGANSVNCMPTVAGDSISGFYRLTRRVIEEGHREIVCLCDPADSDWEHEGRLVAHERAMREAGLKVNHAAFKHGRSLAEGDLAGLRAYLEEYRTATCVICMWGMACSQLVEVAGMMGIRVPDQLSITAHGLCRMSGRACTPGRYDAVMTHLGYDMDSLVNTCFDLLIEQRKTRRTRKTLVLELPYICEGASLKPPAPARTRRPARSR